MDVCRKLCRDNDACTPPEQCTDVGGGQLCLPTNAEPTCGDGVLLDPETCDDGQANSDTAPNACRSNCTKARCGDGVQDTGEECDNGSANSDTLVDACRTDCVIAVCGDGVVDTGEECDRLGGNSDTLANTCRTDCAKANCGDGVIDTGESCDDGESNSDTLDGACRTTCRGAGCGDGVKDDGEACDTGVANSNTVVNACRENCVEAYCGDGVKDGGEDCDDGADISDTTPDACRVGCIAPSCGDGVIDSGEDCDDQNDDSTDGCDGSSCTFLQVVLNTVGSKSLNVSYHNTTGELTIVYVRGSSSIDDQLVSQQLPRPGSPAGVPVLVSDFSMDPSSGERFANLSIAQDGDQVAMAYTRAYTDVAEGVQWWAQHSHLSTSADGGSSWNTSLKRIDSLAPGSVPDTGAGGACPLSTFVSVQDNVFSAVGFIDGKLSVITDQRREYGVSVPACSVPPPVTRKAQSRLFTTDLVSVPTSTQLPTTSTLPTGYVWASRSNGKSVVGFYPNADSSIVMESIDGGATWTQQAVRAYNTSANNGDLYLTHAFFSPSPGRIFELDRRGIDISLYAYGTTDATWTTRSEITSTDAEKRQMVKRVLVSDGAQVATMLWSQHQNAYQDAPEQVRLLRATSSDGGATFGAAEELLLTEGGNDLYLIEATMSAAKKITALVCVGTGMRRYWFRWGFKKWKYSLIRGVPCVDSTGANDVDGSRLGVLRWIDGETPTLADLEYLTPMTPLAEARLVRDDQGRHTAVWRTSGDGTSGIFARGI